MAGYNKMQLLKAVDHRRMPWKNGGGVTVEIAVFPEDASVDSFDWRVSTATVANDGAFSVFAGVDRTLSVLEGDGITLSVEGLEDIILKGETPPFFFPADSTTNAKLLGSAITDLNVMTRRGHFSHKVTRHQINEQKDLCLSGSFVLIFCGSGVVQTTAPASLEAGDCLMMENCEDNKLTLTGNGTLFAITIERFTMK